MAKFQKLIILTSAFFVLATVSASPAWPNAKFVLDNKLSKYDNGFDSKKQSAGNNGDIVLHQGLVKDEGDGNEEPPADEGGEEPPADGGGEEPPADGGDEEPPADGGGEEPPADGGEGTSTTTEATTTTTEEITTTTEATTTTTEASTTTTTKEGTTTTEGDTTTQGDTTTTTEGDTTTTTEGDTTTTTEGDTTTTTEGDTTTTTEGDTTTTTEGDTTTTTEGDTTTQGDTTTTEEPSPDDVPSFTVTDDKNKRCILASMNITIRVPYEATTKDGKTVNTTKTISPPKKPQFVGLCSGNNGTIGTNGPKVNGPILIITWDLTNPVHTRLNENLKVKSNYVAVSFKTEDGETSLNEVTSSITITKQQFPDATKPGTKSTFTVTVDDYTADEGESYSCGDENTYKSDGDGAVTLKDVKFQVGSDLKEKFGDGVDCNDSGDDTVAIAVGVTIGVLVVIVVGGFLFKRYRDKKKFT